MIKLSTKGRYAVRFMLDLAIHSKNSYVSLSNISKRQNISEKYLWQIVSTLKNGGLINSSRGPEGGYALSRHPKDISLNDIIQIVEGNVCVVDCVCNIKACSRCRHCAARDVWKDISKTISNHLAGVTLESIAKKQKKLDLTGSL